jgi:transcriptional regulator with XRE-family HTH domain
MPDGRAWWLLRSSRTRAGISQAELARRTHVPRTVINAYERGTRQPAADTLAQLLAAAGAELEARPAPKVSVERNARILEQVLDLAERMPARRRGQLTFPPLRHLGV